MAVQCDNVVAFHPGDGSQHLGTLFCVTSEAGDSTQRADRGAAVLPGSIAERSSALDGDRLSRAVLAGQIGTDARQAASAWHTFVSLFLAAAAACLSGARLPLENGMKRHPMA